MSRLNRLDNSVCYLSGPIDFDKSDGVSFRKLIRESLSHLNIKFLDPTDKPITWAKEIGAEKQLLRKYKEQGRYDELTIAVKKIRRADLRCCDKADFQIAYIDTSIHMCGTYDEIFTMERQKKPVLALIKGHKKDLPIWLFGAIRHEEMFESLDQLVNYINGLASGKNNMDSRWLLI